MNIANRRDRIFSFRFLQIFFIGFLVNMAQFYSSTLVPLFADYLGATATVAGIVASIFTVGSILARPIGGPAIDYFSKGKLLSALLAIMALASFCHAFFQTIRAVFIFRLIQGIGIGLAIPLTFVMASEELPRDHMASGMGIYMIAQAIAQALGPNLAIALSSRIGFSNSFLFIGSLLVVGLILALQYKTNPPENRGVFRVSLRSIVEPKLILPSLILMILYGVNACITFFLALYGKEKGLGNVGPYFLVNAAFLLFSRPISGRISDRFGPEKVIIPGIILYTIALFLIGRADSLTGIVIAGIFAAFGYGVCAPTLQSVSLLLVGNERRGAASNTNYLFIDLGVLFIPSLGGAIAEAYGGMETVRSGYAAMYCWLTVPILLSLALYLMIREKMVYSA